MVVTPPASGKTLCYNLPVVSAILKNNDARALYLFPHQGALGRSGQRPLRHDRGPGVDIKTYTYDGDTRPPRARPSGRRATRGHQPGHAARQHPPPPPDGSSCLKISNTSSSTRCTTYRGVFGSQLANVLRRLMRMCAFYGSAPALYLLLSATIANPAELAYQLTGPRNRRCVNENGARGGAAFRVLQPARGQPPAGHPPRRGQRGRAASPKGFCATEIQSIVFAAKPDSPWRSSTAYFMECAVPLTAFPGRVAATRGGYLPRAARNRARPACGRGDMVVSTNALELGIDIGSLTACVLCGYPGTIASTWQQAGRAGRRKDGR